MTSSLPLALAVAFMLSGFGHQEVETKPNFTGVWKLNLQSSGPGLPRALEALTIAIDHRGQAIEWAETRVVAGKTTTSISTITIDGALYESGSEQDKLVKHRSSWSGDTLLVFREETLKSETRSSQVKHLLSSNGQVLTTTEHYRGDGVEGIRDWVFEKR